MRIVAALPLVQTRAALLGERVLANENWLLGGFLADERFTPEAYLVLAEQQRDLQRALLALTARLLTETQSPVVA
ncbi:MAG: hypothetical protein QOF01_960 [Thermomicrobiales bacterium]|jgi:hypothetical protein|nr:hypothetical protein [Thermomicrobiales bacterium]MEA2594491.1 hypothetical protein [Thermomicrobiales bacterium]